jgi:hypothetical protein
MRVTEPKDHKVCPVCNLPYAFVRCRVTMADRTNMCLLCAVELEKQHELTKTDT